VNLPRRGPRKVACKSGPPGTHLPGTHEDPPARARTANFRSVSEQISKAREKHPHSVALSYGDRQLSYEELDSRANRLAGHLTQLGIMTGDTVIVCMERSFDWIVSALGIMRTGAAYVPLDSAWPDSRLRFAIKDSGAKVLVARAALLDRLQVKAHGIDPCRDAVAIASSPGVVVRTIHPDSLAYIIYTSGSTGAPKGVEITHANLSHLIRWHRDTFGVTRQDRASHLSGLGFDAAVWEIWPHLAAGATVCLADNAVRSSPDLLQQWMIRERVTISFVPTVHAAQMIEMEWPSTTSLRFLLTGGDVLHHASTVKLPFDVVNNYGPTECTVVATSAVVKPGVRGAPPIGRPIAGSNIYLLNEQGEPVPDGSIGEIYIGGNGVGRGYRNLPDSTERSFLLDPFVGATGGRMYRTGDRGVRRPDGEIEFRGRLDRQTKIRGQRVELDEIGSVLSEHPSIDFATAISNTSGGGENQLVAYVLPKKTLCIPTVRELQRHLLRSLPEFMIPAFFVRLHTRPLSPNGKLDLTMLAPPTDSNLLQRAATKAAVMPIEGKLLAMMQELLKNDEIAAEDNFFLAGGHSLLGMQLVMRVQSAFGVDLTLGQLLEAPTVERLALVVETMLRGQRLAVIWAELLGRRHVGLDDNFFDLGGHPALVGALQKCIATEFGQPIHSSEVFQNPTVRRQAELTLRKVKPERVLPPGVLALQLNGTRPGIFWVHYLNVNLAKEFGDDQPTFLVTLTTADFAALGEKPTLRSIATCLVGKIISTQSKGPYNIGGLCIGSVLAYEMACQLRAAGHEVSLLVLLDAPSPAYLKSHNSLNARLRRPRDLLKRNARLGLRQGLFNLRKRLIKNFVVSVRAKFAWTEIGEAHELIESAAFAYQPERYEGKVLLLLASRSVPHVDFLPGWQAIVPQNLHTNYVDGYHREMMTEQNVRIISDVINSHLVSTSEKEFESAAPILLPAAGSELTE
jgi:amino acid adenylation domain-containing protein